MPTWPPASSAGLRGAGGLPEGRRADTCRPCDSGRRRPRLASTAAADRDLLADVLARSALNFAGEEIIQTLLGSGCNVIAKLHDRSLDPDPRYTGGVNWRAAPRPFSGPHFLLAAGGDSTPYVLASDVMVTDHSSIGFEFCALDRPLIIFDAPAADRRRRESTPRKSRCSVRPQPW